MVGDAFSGAQRLHALHALSPRSGKKRPMQSKPLSPELAVYERMSHLSFADGAFHVALQNERNCNPKHIDANHQRHLGLGLCL